MTILPRNKRILLIFFAFCAAILILYTSLSVFEGKAIAKHYDFSFYEPNYNENILEDSSYLELNRLISFKNGAVTNTIAPENCTETDKILGFIVEYLDTVIKGDSDNYKNYFSSEYLSENTVPLSYTMQRIYNINIEKLNESNADNENGSYTEYIYSVDYMINKNNGTFRQDFGSDASRTQYFLITDRTGELLIDNIFSYNYK